MQFKRGCRGWWIALAVAAADRVTKAAVHRSWDRPHLLDSTYRPLIPGVVNLKMATNRGMAFSMLSGHAVLLTIATAVLIAAVLAWQISKPDERVLFRAGLWMIIGGGLGNLFDRLAYGYVIDFIELAFVRFAVFNVADACICVGAAMAVAGLALSEGDRRRERPARAAGAAGKGGANGDV